MHHACKPRLAGRTRSYEKHSEVHRPTCYAKNEAVYWLQGHACRTLRDTGQSAEAGNLFKPVSPLSCRLMHFLRRAMQKLLQRPQKKNRIGVAHEPA